MSTELNPAEVTPAPAPEAPKRGRKAAAAAADTLTPLYAISRIKSGGDTKLREIFTPVSAEDRAFFLKVGAARELTEAEQALYEKYGAAAADVLG